MQTLKPKFDGYSLSIIWIWKSVLWCVEPLLSLSSFLTYYKSSWRYNDTKAIAIICTVQSPLCCCWCCQALCIGCFFSLMWSHSLSQDSRIDQSTRPNASYFWCIPYRSRRGSLIKGSSFFIAPILKGHFAGFIFVYRLWVLLGRGETRRP